MQKSNSIPFKISRILIAILFSIITVFLLFHNTPLIVHATGSGQNATGDNPNQQASSVIVEGASYKKQFWLVHIVNESGTPISSVVMITCDGMKADKTYLQTRPEHGSLGYSEIIIGTPGFGWAYDSNGGSRASEIKAWMSAIDSSSGQPQLITFIENIWGTDVAEAFIERHWYLCLEDGMWCGYYNDGGYTGKIFAGTAYGWALYNKLSTDVEKWETANGDVKISLYTNNVLPNAIKLEFTQTGLAQPTQSGKLTNIEIQSAGYGCGIFWVENGATHTWDSENHPTDEAPAPTPPSTPPSSDIPSTSTTTITQFQYTIIKSYRLKDHQGNLTDKGTYIREQTVSQITIEDEPLNSTDKNYKVIGWKQSSTKKSNISSLNWESSVPSIIGDTGTSTGTTTLDPQHKYLYVLLEAEEGEPDITGAPGIN